MSQMTQPTQGSQSTRAQTDTQTQVFSTTTDLPEETRIPVIQRLNQSLADTTDLMTQMKFAHWNVKGINFYQLHLLFDEIAEVLEGHADMLAERATSLGGQATGTARMAATNSMIPEMSTHLVTGPQFLQTATEHLALHAANLRQGIDFAASCGDEDTADLYTEISREVDQQVYFLESHLQTEPIGTVEQYQNSQSSSNAQQPQQTAQGQGGVQGQSTQQSWSSGTAQQRQ